jgi:hypothetical protein
LPRSCCHLVDQKVQKDQKEGISGNRTHMLWLRELSRGETHKSTEKTQIGGEEEDGPHPPGLD